MFLKKANGWKCKQLTGRIRYVGFHLERIKRERQRVNLIMLGVCQK